MNYYFYLKKHTVTLIEQRNTKSPETLEFKMNRPMETFSSSPPMDLVEEGKWLLEVTSFETKNSVFIISNENNSFSISIPGRWRIPNCLEDGIADKLKKLLNLRSQNDIELHVDEVSKNVIK